MSLLCIGLNHQSAPVSVLEKASCSGETLGCLLSRLKLHPAIREIAGLSTCNRTEFFAVARELGEGREVIFDELARAGKGTAKALKSYSYTHRNEMAARHLFRVAAGVDSLVVGEAQILGQLRKSYEMALELGTAGGMLNALMMRAISFGRKVRTTTEIGRGNVSTVSVAVNMALAEYHSLSDKVLLVIGAGEIARMVTRHLQKLEVGELLIANRTCATAEEVLMDHPGRFIPIERLQSALEEADLVVCAVGAPHHIVTKDGLAGIMPARRGRRLMLVDLSMPRNVDPKVAELENVRLIGLEHLEAVAQENKNRRKNEISQIEEMVDRETGNFMKLNHTTETGRLVLALRRQAEAVRQHHLRRYGKHFPEETREELSKFTDSLLRSILHDITVNIRDIDAEKPAGRQELELLRKLLNVEPGELKES